MPTKKILPLKILLLSLGFLYACNNQQQKKENQRPISETTKVIDRDVQNGRDLFRDNCAVCHLTNNKTIVGSGLCNVTKRRTKKWLYLYVRDSDKMLQEADSIALKLFLKRKISMPLYPALSDKALDDIFKYIESLNCKDEFGGSIAKMRKG